MYRCAAGVIAIIAITLSGCGVADYNKPITELKDAIDSSIATIERIDSKLTSARNESWRNDIKDNKARLKPTARSCTLNSSGCSLVIEHLSPEATNPYPATSVLPKSQTGLAALKIYVANLKAIVEADTAGKITAHTNAALVSITKIEISVAKAQGQSEPKGPIAAYSEPAGAMISWLVGQYVETVKYNALAKATKRAHPVIVKLNNLHATIGKAAAAHELGTAHKTFTKEKAKYRKTKPKSKPVVGAYVAAVVAYGKALKASAAEPLTAFTAAHEKLTKNLNGEGSVTMADVLAAIGDLKEKAKTFKGLLDGLKKK